MLPVSDDLAEGFYQVIVFEEEEPSPFGDGMTAAVAVISSIPGVVI